MTFGWGFGVNGARTFTGAVSFAVTFGPDGGVPVAVAMLSNARWTFGREHEYVTAAFGAIDASAGICACVLLQFGDSGSVTVTFVSVTLPVFVTVIWNLAVPPTGRFWPFGFLTIAIAGCETGVTVSGSQAPERAG